MSLVRKVTRLCISLVLITSSLALVPQVAQAAPGLDFYFKEEAGTTAQMNLSPFTSGTCHVSRGDFNQNWGTGSPGGSCPSERFTLYGQGFIKAPATGTVSFYSATDDGFVLRINEQTVISDLTDHGLGNPYNATGSISMTEGQYYPIKFWFHENTGAAAMFLRWTYPGLSEPTLIPLANLDTEAPPQDTQNPVIVVGSGVLSATTVEAGKSFSIQYRVTDDVACCNQHDVLFYNAQGQVAFQAPSSKIGGSQTDLTYQAQVSVGVGIAPGTYVAKTQTTDLAGKFSFLQEIGSIQVTAPVPAAPTPSFSAVTSTADGFTTQINNYDPSFSWSVTTTAGVAAVSSSGLVTITGLQPLASATVIVTSSKEGFTDGQASRSGTALDGPPVAVTPTFTAVPQISGTTDTAFATSVLDGCNAQISNYNNKLTWSGTSTFPGSTVTIGETGAIQVRGLGTQNNARITIVNRGANNTSGQANFDCNSWYPVLGIGERTTTSISMVINPISGVNFEFTPSSGVVSPLQGRNFTVSNLRSNVDVSLTVRALANGVLVWPRPGQGSGIFPLGRALTGQTQAALNFSLPANLVVGTPAQLSATGGSGTGAVSFVSNSTNICTVSGSTLTLINGGTCSITATKAGDSTFQEATATATATVTARDVPTVTITSPAANATLNGSFTLSASIATAPGSTAQINTACLLIDGVNNNTAGVNNASRWWSGFTNRGPQANCYGVQNFTSGTISWSLDATTWTNGDHQLAIRVYDSANKESALASVPVRVNIGVPTVTITSPAANATLNGSFTLSASIATAPGSTAQINTACLLIDGVNNNTAGVNNASRWWSGFTNRGPQANCYGVQNFTSGTISWSLDATTWTNGDHQLAIRVYDSANKESALASVPVRVNIGVPTVTITSPAANATLNGSFTLSASIATAPGSTAQINTACLLIDGVNNNTAGVNNASRWWTGFTNRGPQANCYGVQNFTSGTISWSLDATTWTNGDHQLAIRVYDSANKESALASVPVRVNIGVPTVTITSPAANATLNGSFTLSASIATAPGSTAQINTACLLIDGVNNNTAGVNNASRWWSGFTNRGPQANCYGVQNFTSGTISWSLDATTWTNGDHQLAIRVYDSANKESALASVPVRVLNPAPEILQITPADGAVLYGNFNIEVRWKSTAAVTHVGINIPCVSATRGAYQNAPSAQSAPAGLTYFNVSSTGRDSFICQVDGSTQLGTEVRASRKIDVVVIDRASQIATGSTSVALVTPKPTVEIRSPRPSQAVKGELLIEVWAQSPAESQRQISLVGISEADAKPTFNGNRTYYNDRLPSRFTAYRVSSSQAGEWLNFAWTLDLLEYKPGLQTIEVAVQDSNGDVVEKSIQFLVQEPEVQLSFIKPTINQKFAGDLEVKVLAKGDPLTKNKIRTIAIDLKELKPTFVGSELGDWQSKVPRNFRAWDLDTRNIPEEFTWTAEAGSIPNGTYTLSVIAIDDKNYSKTQTITFEVNTPNPEVRILSPEIGIIANQPFDIVASVEIPKIANAQVDLVGINIRDAVPAFVAQPVRLTNSNQLRDFIFWQVEDAKTFSWKINPDSWPDGNRSITVLVLDTNNRVGQSSVALHKAPQATWKFEVKDPPVLGKSVAIGVTMTTSSQRLLEPVVTAKLQQATSPRGPWNDAGTLTFDKANIAAGRIVVTSPMYIRVYHENLDSVQPGASEPFRIINVPDPNRGGSSKSSGATNADGSIPTVTCTPPARSVLNTRLTVSCTAVDVQNPAQTFNVYQLQGKAFKRAGAARLTGNLISFSTTIRKSGTYTFEVRGEGSSGRFTPWRSNRIIISIKK